MADQQFSKPTNPEDDVLVLQLRDDRGAVTCEVKNFVEYTFNSDYLTPTDGFHFAIGDETVLGNLKKNVYVGQEVTLSVNGYVQAGGFVDRIKIKSTRGGGSEMHVEGRDWLSPAVDACMDPRKSFQSSNTLLDVIVGSLADYGFGSVGQILASDEANGNIITGQNRGFKVTKKRHRVIKSFLAHQLKPYPHEGVFAFASRMSQRFGLWIDASADGENLIVDEPDFTQKAIYELRNLIDEAGNTNNLIEAELDINAENQPTIIVATGVGGGGDQSCSGMKCIAVNELYGIQVQNIGADAVVRGRPSATAECIQFVEKIIGDNVGANVLETRDDFDGLPYFPHARPRVIYLHDDESHTADELASFVRRELALKQQHGFVYRTQHEGHTINRVPIYTNSVANVDDEVSSFKNRTWCRSRTFSLARGGGTTSHAEWLLPFTLDFGT